MLKKDRAIHEILELPDVDPAAIDGLFQINPSSIDGWMNTINSRELSTMELGAISHEELVGFADDIKEALPGDTTGSERALVAAGALYGTLIAGHSPGDQERKIDSLNLDEAKDTVVTAYNSADRDYLSQFLALRNCEIDYFASDIISVTFSSVQDHIADIAPSGDKLQNQLMFYMGAIAGAMAVLPKDGTESPSIVMRDFPDSIGPEGYFPIRVEHEAADSASDAAVVALEQQIGFRHDGDRKITVRNNRLIQFEPNGVTIHNDGPKIPVQDIAKVVYIEKEADESSRPSESQGPMIVPRAVGMVTRKHGFVFNSYHPAHPYYDFVNNSLLEANDEGIVVPPQKLYVVSETQQNQKTIRRASVAAVGVLGVEQIVSPSLTQTLAALGTVALAKRYFSNSIHKRAVSALDE